MPTYHSPPQTPARFPLHRTPLPLSTSHFHSSSARNSNTSRGSKTPKHRSRKDDDDSQYKIPFVFLGSIAAVSWLAHRFWPKGFPQGEKKDSELSDHARRAKQRREAEKAEMSARRADRRSSSMNHSNREPSTASDAFGKEDALRDYDSYRDREGEGRGGYYPSSKSRATANEDREVYKYRSQPPSSRPRYSSRSVDGYGAATNSNSRGGSSSSRQRHPTDVDYSPPAPALQGRYLLHDHHAASNFGQPSTRRSSTARSTSQFERGLEKGFF